MSVNKILSDGSIVPFAGTPNARISGFQDILNNNGAKNLLDIEGWFKSKNVTYTEVADNSYSVSDIGTSYSQPLVLFDTPTDIIISGDITQGARYTNFRIQLYDTNGVAIDFFGGNEVKVSGVNRIRLNYANSTTSTDYPVMTNIMIRRASDVDSTFEPFAMTNRKLTEKVLGLDTVSVTADGVKTVSQLLDDLFAVVDWSRVTGGTWIDTPLSTTNDNPAYYTGKSGGTYFFSSMVMSTTTTVTMSGYYIKSSGSKRVTCSISNGASPTVSDNSSPVFASGRKVILTY